MFSPVYPHAEGERKGGAALWASGICLAHEVHNVPERHFVCPYLEKSCLYHNPAEGAGNGNRGGARLKEFPGSPKGGALVGFLFHPHTSSPRSTAERFLPEVRGFREAVSWHVHGVAEEHSDRGIQIILIRWHA